LTASTQIYYRTMTGLIHPAVLGAIIVNLIQSVLSGAFFKLGSFPIFASIILVWYFIIDFWVIISNFEDTQEEYNVFYFLLDIITLIILFGAFYFLWSLQNDTLFFLSIIFLLIVIIIWSVLIIGKISLKDPIDIIQFSVLAFAVVPFITSIIKPHTNLHLMIKYFSLGAIFIALIFYSKITLKD